MICEVCNNQVHLNETFDAYYCDPCDEWKEKKCADDECRCCTARPARPSMIEPEDCPKPDFWHDWADSFV